MVGGDDVRVDGAPGPARDAEGCLVCGDGADLRRHTVSVDETTHTVSLCGDHHEFVRRDRPQRGDESFSAAETRKVTARVPTALLEDVDERASELEVPRSELIRDCLRDGLYAADTDVSPDDFLAALVEMRLDIERLEERLSGAAGNDGPTNGRLDGTAAAVEGVENGAADGDAGTAGGDGVSHWRDEDVEFLKERIVRLESLLERALGSDPPR
jgi:hypothetical protein